MASNGEDFAGFERLTTMIGEFPRMDDRFAGRPYRYGWLLVIDPTKPVEIKGGSPAGSVMNSLGFVDHETGTEQKWWCGSVSSLQEPCFIPRGPGEGNGWIVMVCNRLEEHRSDLLLFDALDVAKGPIATIRIPVRLRFGLHGNWADAAEIGLAA
jgi:carotenoid cleavage dioxygenase-like enzyme